MNHPDRWTLELAICGRRSDGEACRIYTSERDARAALACIYALSRHLGPPADRYGGPPEIGRWRIRTYDLSPTDEKRLATLRGEQPDAVMPVAG